MAVTTDSFLTEFPEFANNRADRDLVEAKIAHAMKLVDAAVWGNSLDLAVSLRAAHLIAISPWGQQARLSNDGLTSTYDTEYRRLAEEVAIGLTRVLLP